MSSRLVMASLVELLLAIAGNLRLEDELFDELIEMLVPILHNHPHILNLLNSANPDALWLALQRPPSSNVAESRDESPGLLIPRSPRWNFARV